MVGDEHEVADAHPLADPPRRVGDQQGPGAQLEHEPGPEDHRLGAVALVEVDPSLHGDHLGALGRPQHQVAGVPRDARDRHPLDVPVGNGDPVLEAVGEGAEPRAEHHRHLRSMVAPLAHRPGGGVETLREWFRGFHGRKEMGDGQPLSSALR